MEKHTPEELDALAHRLDNLGLGAEPDGDGVKAFGLPADWEPIAKAVEACDGIPTEALTPGSIKALIDIVTSTTDALGELRANDFADGDSFAVVFSSLQKLTNAVATFKPAQTEPAPIDPDELADILELIDEEHPPDVIAGWTDAQREEVAGWAGAVFLKASDNPVKVPPKPAFMTR